MDLQSKVGQMFFIGLHGTEGSDELAEYLDEVRPGGIIQFARNLQNPAQIKSFNSWLSQTLDPAPLIAIDQEGGRVNRLSEFLGPMPKAVSFAAPGGEAKLAEYAKRSAHALESMGFNMNFAPVVDLSAPGAASGIGDRSFGTDPKVVTHLAGIYLDALQAEGVAGVLKHFPGLGPTDADTHQLMPSTSKTPDALWVEDMVPFRELAPRAGGIMIGHAHYSAIDDDRSVAATLSTHVVKEQLREKMGFDGLAITDDMEMGAVAQEMTPDELALFAFLMGSDMVMFAGNKTRILNARRGIVRAIHAARLFKDRIDQSIGRILAVKERFSVESFGPELVEADYAAAKAGLQGVAQEIGVA